MSKNKHKNRNQKEGNGRQKKDLSLLPRGVWPKAAAVLIWLFAVIFVLSFFGKAGFGGKFLLRGFSFLIGKTVYAFPAILLLTGIFLFLETYHRRILPTISALFCLLLGIAGILAINGKANEWGGILGFLFTWPLLKIFDVLVSEIICGALIFLGLLIFSHLVGERRKREQKMAVVYQPSGESAADAVEKQKPKIIALPEIEIRKKIQNIPIISKKTAGDREASDKADRSREIQFQPFPLDLLEPERGKPNSGDINKNAALIKNTLENFAIPSEMGDVNIGPTVTQYTLKPADGIKLSKITTLSNNLSLALAAHPLRIEAPIPGKSLVGIEVPNKERAEVRLKNLLEMPEYQNSESRLIIALGRDVAGNPVFTDIARMPHLLVAGSTGTGKTIFLNNLVLTLLQKNSPETLRLIMVDPKRVEFAVYKEMPHLLGPVIFDPDKAVLAIRWMIGEMEKRFKTLAAAGARDVRSYNAIVFKTLKDIKGAPGSSIMPYIIFIIDELADLMAAKGREIEAGIVRLAQMARAVGIHLVVATQRPSVEVLTGLIKANITSRITFQVATQVDSRTVLDMAGAEKLLGSGDMLFLSAQTLKPKRIQSAYISDKEVRKVMDWLQGRPEYFGYNTLNTSLADALNQDIVEEGIAEISSEAKGEDILYEEAKRVVIEARKASASLLQRRLRIGYARAARLLDILESRGMVGPADGARPREVYGVSRSVPDNNFETDDFEQREDQEEVL